MKKLKHSKFGGAPSYFESVYIPNSSKSSFGQWTHEKSVMKRYPPSLTHFLLYLIILTSISQLLINVLKTQEIITPSTFSGSWKVSSKMSAQTSSNLSIIPRDVRFFLAVSIISDEMSRPQIFLAPKSANFCPIGHGPHPTSRNVFP